VVAGRHAKRRGAFILSPSPALISLGWRVVGLPSIMSIKRIHVPSFCKHTHLQQDHADLADNQQEIMKKLEELEKKIEELKKK
jgi:hypothetical protein